MLLRLFKQSVHILPHLFCFSITLTRSPHNQWQFNHSICSELMRALELMADAWALTRSFQQFHSWCLLFFLMLHFLMKRIRNASLKNHYWLKSRSMHIINISCVQSIFILHALARSIFAITVSFTLSLLISWGELVQFFLFLSHSVVCFLFFCFSEWT